MASHTPGHTTLKSLRAAASIVGARIRPDGFGNYALLDSSDVVCVCADTRELRESLEVYFSGHAQWSDALAEMSNA